MGILSAITGDTVPFRWGYTEKRAFDEVKTLAQQARDHRRVPLDYSSIVPPIWMITDGCSTGISGLISQGDDWKTANITAFYSAKLNSAQQNYPVHEIEFLAGVETMLRHTNILQGQWLTDHKGLTYLLNQKNLSGWQARWLEKISSFMFKVVYIPGSENVVADALSRMYSNDSLGTQRWKSEFTYHDVVDNDTSNVDVFTPVLAGIEARVTSRRSTRECRLTDKAATVAEESWNPETSHDLAHWMVDRFVLHSPAEQKEGGSMDISSETNTLPENPTLPDAEQEPISDIARTPNPEAEDGSTHPLLLQSNLGVDLLKELRDNYEADAFFKPIRENPSQFRKLR